MTPTDRPVLILANFPPVFDNRSGDVERARSILDELAERAASGLKLGIHIPGFLADLLWTSFPDTLRLWGRLQREGRADIYCSPFYEPEPQLVAEGELERHLTAGLAFWDKAGAGALKSLWLTPRCQTADAMKAAALLGLDRPLFERAGQGGLDRTVSPVLLEIDRSPWRGSILSGAASGKEGSAIAAAELVEDLSLLRLDQEQAIAALEGACSRFSRPPWQPLFLSELPGAESPLSAAPLPLPERPEEPELQRLDRRLDEVRQQLLLLPEKIEEQPNLYANRLRHEDTWRWLMRAQHRESALWGDSPYSRYRSRRRVYEALLQAQVSIDVVLHPEIDPVVGWLQLEERTPPASREPEMIIDTPFMRYYFSAKRGGSAVEIGYKPRKINLLNMSPPPEAAGALVGRLLHSISHPPEPLTPPPPLESAEAKLVRRSPDIAAAAFVQPLELDGYRASLHRHVAIKAGLGAHLPNSTTGFSVEYWLEAAEPPAAGLYLALDILLMLPAGNCHGIRARALMCVGAVAEQTVLLSEPRLFGPDSVPGGLYGLRLIDGIEHLMIDLRSAKHLEGLQVVPIPQSPYEGREETPGLLHQALLVRVISRAEDRCGEEKMNVVFVSIP